MLRLRSDPIHDFFVSGLDFSMITTIIITYDIIIFNLIPGPILKISISRVINFS